jgi:hypothetical protein
VQEVSSRSISRALNHALGVRVRLISISTRLQAYQLISQANFFNMVQLSLIVGLAALSQVLAAPAPAPTAAPDLEKRATTCTFSGSSGASLASKSKTSCSTIILSALAVPSGVTLDLTDLNKGTTVSIVSLDPAAANSPR